MKNLPLILGGLAVGGYLIYKSRQEKSEPTTTESVLPLLDETIPDPIPDDTDYSELIAEVNNLKSLTAEQSALFNTVSNDLNEYKSLNDLQISQLFGDVDNNASSVSNVNTDLNNYKNLNDQFVSALDTKLGNNEDDLSNYKSLNDLQVSQLFGDVDSNASNLTNYKNLNDEVLQAYGESIGDNVAATNALDDDLQGYKDLSNLQLGVFGQDLESFEDELDTKTSLDVFNAFQDNADAFYNEQMVTNADLIASLGQKANTSAVNSAADDASFAKNLAEANLQNYQSQQTYQTNTIIPNIVDNQGDIQTNAGNIASNTNTLGQKANTSYVNQQVGGLQSQIDNFENVTQTAQGSFFSGGRGRVNRRVSISRDGFPFSGW